MNQHSITIAIDAMGGDDSPFKCLKGTEIFTNNFDDAKIILIGDEKLIIDTIKNKKLNLKNYIFINTTIFSISQNCVC